MNDCFFLLRNDINSDNTLETLNRKVNSVKFTIELGKKIEHYLFLYLNMHRKDHCFDFIVYEKKTDKSCMHTYSEHKNKIKRNSFYFYVFKRFLSLYADSFSRRNEFHL